MARRFEEKVVLVTGGASGIGAATAIAFANEGAKVVIADLQESTAGDVLAKAESLGLHAIFVKADVADAADSEAMVQRAVERYGRLDIAINNAGVLQQAMPLAELSEETFDRVLAINLKGVFLGMKYQIRQMLRQGSGVIVNMTSFGALVGAPGLAAYIASKHGIAGLTKAAALDYAQQGIRINAIAPGVVRTPMFDRLPAEAQAGIIAAQPIGRAADPDEIAKAILYLASDEASFMVGNVMVVDGGLTAQ